MTPPPRKSGKWKICGYLLLGLMVCYLLLWIFARSDAVALLYIVLIAGVYIQLLFEALITLVLPVSL